MRFPHDTNPTPTPTQDTLRVRELRVWMLRNGVTWVDMGKHMTGFKGRPVTGSAVQKALSQERMHEDNHKALMRAYPLLPLKLLPRPENVPTGPKPKRSPKSKE